MFGEAGIVKGGEPGPLVARTDIHENVYVTPPRQ
jgi:hypothetical protein